MKKPELIFDYLQYRLTAKKRHGIHSPFVFDFVEQVLCDAKHYPEYSAVESLRKELLASREVLIHQDWGGSDVAIPKQKTIGEIARNSCSNRKYGRLLFRLSRRYQPRTILELGTSGGISALSLSAGNPQASVYTIEGCPNTSRIAAENFTKLNAGQITLYTGSFDHVLPDLLHSIPAPDLVFFDGNHHREPTLRYFQRCLHAIQDDALFIFDDIRWSKPMKEAWTELCAHERISVSIDLFRLGILFIRKGQAKQHFRIRF